LNEGETVVQEVNAFAVKQSLSSLFSSNNIDDCNESQAIGESLTDFCDQFFSKPVPMIVTENIDLKSSSNFNSSTSTNTIHVAPAADHIRDVTSPVPFTQHADEAIDNLISVPEFDLRGLVAHCEQLESMDVALEFPVADSKPCVESVPNIKPTPSPASFVSLSPGGFSLFDQGNGELAKSDISMQQEGGIEDASGYSELSLFGNGCFDWDERWTDSLFNFK